MELFSENLVSGKIIRKAHIYLTAHLCLYMFVSKQDIKEAVQKKVYYENRQRMLESRKVRDRLDNEETFGLEREKSSYLDRMPMNIKGNV